MLIDDLVLISQIKTWLLNPFITTPAVTAHQHLLPPEHQLKSKSFPINDQSSTIDGRLLVSGSVEEFKSETMMAHFTQSPPRKEKEIDNRRKEECKAVTYISRG